MLPKTRSDSVYLSIDFQDRSTGTTVKSAVTREPLISVPFKSVLPGNMINTIFEVVIYHHRNNTMNVQQITLSSLPGSILNYTRFIKSSISTNRYVNADDYVLNVNTKHNLEIGI